MRNIKLVIEYNGSSFYGFQKQPHHPTVQESLEKTLSKILNGATKIQAASGRTDTGVHAFHQVVNFQTDNPMAIKKMQAAINSLLPDSVVIKNIKEVSPDFHARFSAKSKVYEYHIWNSPLRSPLKGTRAWHIPHALNHAAMKKGMALIRGTHDFSSFCAAHGASVSKVRTVKKFAMIRGNSRIVFRIEADGFLYHMVRNIIGTLVDLGRGRITVPQLKRIIDARDRKQSGPTAPPQGLVLSCVKY